jgi:hypothetical protein
MNPFRFEVTADNEMPTDNPSDFDDAYADIERWITKYSESADADAAADNAIA